MEGRVGSGQSQVRVPAPVLYAMKLAKMIGSVVKQAGCDVYDLLGFMESLQGDIKQQLQMEDK